MNEKQIKEAKELLKPFEEANQREVISNYLLELTAIKQWLQLQLKEVQKYG